MDIHNSYYRLRFPDRQDTKIYTHCAYTGMEIYEGDECIKLDNGEVILNDMNILLDYYNAEIIVAGGDESK